jgi:hypothetical protein
VKKLVFLLVILALVAGAAALYHAQESQRQRSDTYLDKAGCAESRSGGIHPDYCVKLDK